MKIYSRKNLLGGICYTCLALLYLWQNRGQLDAISPIDWSILACVIAAACIRGSPRAAQVMRQQSMSLSGYGSPLSSFCCSTSLSAPPIPSSVPADRSNRSERACHLTSPAL